MGGVGGVLHDAVGFAGASCKENVQDGWERGTDDLCSRVHCPLEGLAVSSIAVPVPDSDAAGQHTLNAWSCQSQWCSAGYIQIYTVSVGFAYTHF